jgi:uncharacterized membrane protein
MENNNLARRIENLVSKIDDIKTELNKIKADALNYTEIKELVTIVKEEVKPVLKPVPEEKVEPIVITPPVTKKPVLTPPVVLVKPKVPQKSFFERNPNMEKFIGENLMNKIGIAILVIGIGIFVKYAIDQDWIGPVGRVMIGILCGGILLGFAHYLRKEFKAFSSVLIGGGVAILYLTIAIAYKKYPEELHITQTVAFIIMVFITGFTVLFAIAYNRVEIAILAILGGFLSPFMVSSGEGNYKVLFSYLLILNCGMLILGYFKKWISLNIICYVLTVLIYAGWLIKKDVLYVEDGPLLGAFIFATAFFLIFFLMNIINNLREGNKFTALDFTLILSNAALYFAAGLAIVKQYQEGLYTGLFTVLNSIFFFGFAFILYKKEKIDRNLVYLLIGLVLTFISLSAPIQLKGNNITLFWAAEAVLLLWLSQKSGIRIMRTGSLIVMVLMWVSLVMDWNNIYLYYMYEEGSMSPIVNRGFATGVVSIVSLILYSLLLGKNDPEEKFVIMPTSDFRNIIRYVSMVVIFAAIHLELSYQMAMLPSLPYHYPVLVIGTFYSIYLIALSLYARWKDLRVFQAFLSVLILLNFAYFLVYLHGQTIDLRNNYLTQADDIVFSIGYFLFHYINVLAILGLLFLNQRYFSQDFVKTRLNKRANSVFSLFMMLFIVSSELDHTIIMTGFTRITDPDMYYLNYESIDKLKDISQKIAWPIAWGIFSFVLMVIGMKGKKKHLRIASLALFLITLVKLGVYDIKDVSEGGKIAAFISLGLILLIISFMYQKLKILLLEDEMNQNEKPV